MHISIGRRTAAALVLALAVPAIAHAQKQKKGDWETLLRDPGIEVCLNSRKLAPNVERSTNCRKQGVMPYGKVEVLTPRGNRSVKVTVYDNGWTPTVQVCQPARDNSDIVVCTSIGPIDDKLEAVERHLDAHPQ